MLISLISLAFIVVLYFFPVSFSGNLLAAAGGKPFGGQIQRISICSAGLLIKLKPAGGSPTDLMWLKPSPPYLYNLSKAPKVGQFVLGMSSGNEVCFLGKTVVGRGQVIKFYGSSK